MNKEPKSETYLADCMDIIKTYPDKYFDLAVVDPPYGISQPAFRKNSVNKACKTKQYNNTVYRQKSPDNTYFKELFRVSKNQIIWGANYYNNKLPYGRKWIFWDKKTDAAQWGDGELAFTSFNGAITKFEFAWNGMIQGNMKNKETRIHPTQKPVALYDWIFKNYAKEEDKIIDTHLGSGSSRISAYKAGLDFVGIEVDEDYFNAQEKRFKIFKSQLRLF